MFRKIGDALRRFMAGRYGTDKLNQWLLGLAIVLIVLGLIGGRAGSTILAVLGTVAYVPLIWSLFRMYSRNIEARRRENAAFQRVLTQLKDRDPAIIIVQSAARPCACRVGAGKSISAARSAASSS